ncbi:Metal transporter Nramp5 [Dichanthelium oligosanthes]|uniref:Metal transporter Nramp5 n=1 Tax=Dichanthelium oligosanthes TaxID=888268 RepID=A0A1E5VT35_9POAL|nr:Metal transporter Nramp5 [Dichanthelium oligosanthes]
MEIERETLGNERERSWGANVAQEESKKLEDSDQLIKQPAWKRFLAHIGPGFMVSLAYLDPGNLETDLQAGANHRYELLWVILIGLIFALIIQSLAANLGVVTGRHLAEICKSEYPKFVRICLWILAEIAVIAADIPEVIGTAFALNLLFHIPVWVGVLITGSSTLLLLGLQKYGVRKLEFLISMLVFVMAACFFGEMSFVKPPAVEVLKGLFIPKLNGAGATGDAIALLGALIMPHNLFLHSALVLSRKTPSSVRGIKDACRFFLYESGFALFVALLINIAVISVSGTVCFADNISAEDADRCSDLTLDSSSFLLKACTAISLFTLGGLLFNLLNDFFFVLSVLRSERAGQVECDRGFLDIRMKKWLRNLMTRCVAIAPSLVVSIIGGSSGAGRLIIIASVIVFSWLLGLMLIGINMYFLSTSFVGWLIHNSLPKYANVLVGFIVFPLMLIYVFAVIYLTFRKDTVVTFVADSAQVDAEKAKAAGEEEDEQPVPFRQDLADIPLPE